MERETQGHEQGHRPPTQRAGRRGITPGSQRGGRGEEKQAACRKAPRSLGAESVRCQAVCADWLNNSRKQRCGPWRMQIMATQRITSASPILTINEYGSMRKLGREAR